MRELKFRIWDPLHKEMVGPWTTDDLMEGCYPMGLHTAEGVVRGDFIWLQYTGVKDNTEKEIYEGDIVKIFTGENCEVEFGEYCLEDYYPILGWHVQGYSIIEEELEVIGNIYENPELLGAK